MSLAALAACAPDLGPLPRPTPVQSLESQKSFAAPEASWPQADWWKAYGDPQLDGLMDEALAGSPDLKIA
jgi:outer membrane protein TolC